MALTKNQKRIWRFLITEFATQGLTVLSYSLLRYGRITFAHAQAHELMAAGISACGVDFTRDILEPYNNGYNNFGFPMGFRPGVNPGNPPDYPTFSMFEINKAQSPTQALLLGAAIAVALAIGAGVQFRWGKLEEIDRTNSNAKEYRAIQGLLSAILPRSRKQVRGLRRISVTTLELIEAPRLLPSGFALTQYDILDMAYRQGVVRCPFTQKEYTHAQVINDLTLNFIVEQLHSPRSNPLPALAYSKKTYYLESSMIIVPFLFFAAAAFFPPQETNQNAILLFNQSCNNVLKSFTGSNNSLSYFNQGNNSGYIAGQCARAQDSITNCSQYNPPDPSIMAPFSLQYGPKLDIPLFFIHYLMFILTLFIFSSFLKRTFSLPNLWDNSPLDGNKKREEIEAQQPRNIQDPEAANPELIPYLQSKDSHNRLICPLSRKPLWENEGTIKTCAGGVSYGSRALDEYLDGNEESSCPGEDVLGHDALKEKKREGVVFVRNVPLTTFFTAIRNSENVPDRNVAPSSSSFSRYGTHSSS